jgi:hypothetical protein
VPEPTFVAKIVGIHRAFDDADVSHAFGGALALAYYAEPRATVDIDLNVFVPGSQADAVLEMIAALGVNTDGAAQRVHRDGQCRTQWGQTPVDFFFADLPFHDAMRRAVRHVPGPGGGDMPIIAPQHLLVCKALFNRPKDWLDIHQMLVLVPDLRVSEVTRWMRELAGDDDGRTQRLKALIAELLGR